MRDLITQRWFDPHSVNVTIEPDVPNVFDPLDLVGISGAFSNSKLTVRNTGMFIRLEVENFAVRKHWRELFFDIDRDCWVIYNRKFRVHEGFWGSDLAARSVAVQAHAAQRIGIGRLVTYAVGDYNTANFARREDRWSGYWVWPRIGFDADIPPSILPRLTPPFNGYKRLSELVATEEGEQEWYLHGDSVHVEFDLQPGSTSWKTLERYTSKRDIRV